MSFDDSALGSHLKPDFDTLTHDITKASDISHTDKELNNAATHVRYVLVQDWSAGCDSSWILPDEILASFFELLPLLDRVAVSHVCRRWRLIALAHPAIWAEIKEPTSCLDGQALVCMALGRTGQHPVSLWLRGDSSYSRELLSCLAKHMAHIQELSWTGDYECLPLNSLAPKLSTVHARALEISSEFLGGEAGNLTSLCIHKLYLPPTCQALSTLTVLDIDGPVCASAAANYDQLFALCPCLACLQISSLNAELAHALPAGPAPDSLEELYLEGIEDDEYDLMRHYTAWKTRDNLTVVTLAQDCASPADLAALIGGAVALVIGEEDAPSRTRIGAFGPDSDWHRRIGFQDVAEGHAVHVAGLIADVRASIPDLDTLDIEIAYLDAFLPHLSSWHELAQLTLRVDSAENLPGDSNCWASLRSLSQIRKYCPSITSVVAYVATASGSQPPSGDDARALLALLALCDVPDVLVKGFSNTVIAALDTPNPVHGRVGIRFEHTDDSDHDRYVTESPEGSISILDTDDVVVSSP